MSTRLEFVRPIEPGPHDSRHDSISPIEDDEPRSGIIRTGRRASDSARVVDTSDAFVEAPLPAPRSGFPNAHNVNVMTLVARRADDEVTLITVVVDETNRSRVVHRSK